MVLEQTTLEEVRKAYPEIPLGRSNDLSGKEYGRLKVLYRTQGPAKEGYWICKCQCGNYCLVRARCLNNKSSSSCGCLAKEIRKIQHHQEPEDLTGKIFGRLTVLKYAGRRNEKNYWTCQCKCGNIKDIAGNNLRAGTTKSCGCLNDELRRVRNANNHVSLVGEQFGHLRVIEDMGFNSTAHNSMSKCICDCGKEVIVSNGNLKNGNTQSCGCDSSSHGEKIIRELLTANNISFITEYTPTDLEFKGRYDFAILDSNNEILYFIEYDGKQHFNSYIGIYKADREHDIIKNDYCYESGIPLIRIPYTVKNITIDDLRIETSKYIMSEAKEKEYYGI